MQSLVNMWDGVLESSYYNATENKNTFFCLFFFSNTAHLTLNYIAIKINQEHGSGGYL